MPVVVYMDETGDHSLDAADAHFPVFVLTMVVCDTDCYATQIVPRFYRFKFDHFGHESVILHSRRMRKSEGPFSFLADPAKRGPFYERLCAEMAACDYQVISIGIRKERHRERYGAAARNPYRMSIEFALERLLPLLEGLGQTSVDVVAEARGRREDAELRRAFDYVVTRGSYYIDGGRFRAIAFKLHFVPKAMNVVGTQLADLVGFPVARYMMEGAAYRGPLWPIVQRKMYAGPGWVRGLKIFP